MSSKLLGGHLPISLPMPKQQGNKTSTEQSKLIGKHPDKPILGTWLLAEDLPTSPTKRHRKLTEEISQRDPVTTELVRWLLHHHVSEARLAIKKAILHKYGFDKYAGMILPFNEVTRKGNIAEILLAEYLVAASGLHLFVYRLRYNPNVDQSMKGDDVLLFNVNNLREKIIVGEAKFRESPTKQTVDEIMNKFEGSGRLPMSIPFIAQILTDQGNGTLADDLETLNAELHAKKIPVVNAGFLWSNLDTANQVEKHLNSNNQHLILISLSMDNQSEFVAKCFRLALDNLKKQ